MQESILGEKKKQLNHNRTPNTFYDCKECGKKVVRYVSPSAYKKGTPGFCCKSCGISFNGRLKTGARGSNWKGGKSHSGGRILVLCPDHPYANYHGRVLEHRLVMEKHIGRTLLPSEIVHHINHDSSDNRIENLQLYASNSQHVTDHNNKRWGNGGNPKYCGKKLIRRGV